MWLGDAPGRARAEEAEETSVVRGGGRRRGAHAQERRDEREEAHSVRHDNIAPFANRIARTVLVKPFLCSMGQVMSPGTLFKSQSQLLVQISRVKI